MMDDIRGCVSAHLLFSDLTFEIESDARQRRVAWVEDDTHERRTRVGDGALGVEPIGAGAEGHHEGQQKQPTRDTGVTQRRTWRRRGLAR